MDGRRLGSLVGLGEGFREGLLVGLLDLGLLVGRLVVGDREGAWLVGLGVGSVGANVGSRVGKGTALATASKPASASSSPANCTNIGLGLENVDGTNEVELSWPTREPMSSGRTLDALVLTRNRFIRLESSRSLGSVSLVKRTCTEYAALGGAITKHQALEDCTEKLVCAVALTAITVATPPGHCPP